MDSGRAFYAGLLDALTSVMGTAKGYLHEHGPRVGMLATQLGAEMGLDEVERSALVFAAVLSDMGMVGLAEDAWENPVTELSDEVRARVKQHPQRSEQRVREIPHLEPLGPLIRHHHEWWDGSGYPDGLWGPAIPLGAQILRIADTVTALGADRPQRSAVGRREVAKIVRASIGKEIGPEVAETFLELDDYLEKLAEQRYEEQLKEDKQEIEVGPAEARKRGVELIRGEDLDDQHRNLLRLVGGQVRVGEQDGAVLFKPLGAFVYCGSAMDVAHAVRLAKDNGFFDRLVLVLGGECFKALGELKKAARPVVLPPELVHKETDPLTGEIRETFVPKKISEAGLLYAIVPGPDRSLAERMLNYQAARLVRHGVSRDEALRAITLNPAKVLGLDQRLGSIEPGKDAHLVVFSGDPLDFNSVVERVFIDGIPAYEREKDVRLKRLLSQDEDGERNNE